MRAPWQWVSVDPATIARENGSGATTLTRDIINPRMNALSVALKNVDIWPTLPGEVGVKDPIYYYGDVRRYGAVGDGVTNDTDAFVNAVTSCRDTGLMAVTVPGGRFRITDSIVLTSGVFLQGLNQTTQGAVWRNGTGFEADDLVTFIYVDFGSGSTDLADAAIQCDNSPGRTGVVGIAFWYPDQDMTASTPTVFPATIAVGVSAHSVVVERCTFINSYVAIDASRIHASVRVTDCVGFPLFRGCVTGSMVDNDYYTRVTWHPLYAYRNGVGALEAWVAENGYGFHGGRCSWSTWTDCFTYGYRRGFNFETVAADPPNVTAGSAENCHFTNCGSDGAAEYGFNFEGACWGNVLTSCMAATNDPRGVALDDSAGFRYAPSGSLSIRDITLQGCRVHGARKRAFRILAADSGGMNNCVVQDFGLDGVAVTAISVSNCEDFSVTNCFVWARNATAAGCFGIEIGGTSIGCSALNNKFFNFDGRGIVISDTASRYAVQANGFRGGNLPGILDQVNDPNSIISGNIDDQQVFSAGNSIVSTGTITIPVNSNLFEYTGTSGISAIAAPQRNRIVRLLFTQVVTITNSASLALQGGINATTAAGDLFSFESDGTNWYEISRKT